MILVIDNYDSFVFNLARYLTRLGQQAHVVRNDAIDLAQLEQLRPAAIVLSPGPCGPAQAGRSLDIVRAWWRRVPMLGICLGHQTIAAAFGARIVRAAEPVHGRASPVQHNGKGIFDGLPNPLVAARYHSLVVDEATLPDCFEVSARLADGTIMAIRHRQRPVVGLQFHPESVLTEQGYALLANFLQRAHLPRPPRQLSIADELVQPPPRSLPQPARPITF